MLQITFSILHDIYLFEGWEQTYNCGHDNSVFEQMGRLAEGMDEKGAVNFSNSASLYSTILFCSLIYCSHLALF
jgi:hypothetical protein